MNPHDIRETVIAFQKSRILLSAYELDIFTILGRQSHTAESMSIELNADPNATGRLLNVLVALNLLKKDQESYRNTEEGYKYLSKESPDYMGGLMHSNHLWNTWSHLTEVVRTGDVAHREEINQRGEEWLEAFINAMHYRGKKQAPAQIASIDLQKVGSVLDVGGGSGCFCMEFINQKPGVKTAVFDLPNVLPISEKIIHREGYAGQIQLHSGDYTRDALPGGFDLVFLSAIIHSNSYETNEALVQKCYNALNPGGRLIIQDWIMNDAKTEPLQGAIFAINMLVGVEGGDCYSESEITQWMHNTGFTDVSKTPLESGLGQMTGVKKTDSGL